MQNDKMQTHLSLFFVVMRGEFDMFTPLAIQTEGHHDVVGSRQCGACDRCVLTRSNQLVFPKVQAGDKHHKRLPLVSPTVRVE